MNTTKLIQDVKRETKSFLESGQVALITVTGYHAYLQTGNRLVFEKQYFARRKQLATLGLALQIEEDKESVIELLEKVIWEICNEYSWALPAHLPITEEGLYHADSPQVIDLFAAETAQTLSEILEIHGNLFSDLIKKRVITEIEKRVLIPFETKEWEWECLENNWSAVIGGCIGMTALSLLEKRSKRQTKIIDRLQTSFHHYLNGFKVDGVCVEGISYWAYGFGYYLYFAEKYHQVLEDDRFLKPAKLKEIASFPYRAQIGPTTYVPFSDAGEDSLLPSGLLSFCHHYYDVPVPDIKEASTLDFDHCYRWAHLYRNLNWTKPIPNVQTEGIHYFPNAEWLIARTKNLIFAAKGGRNDESHNHNDLGHFILGTENELILTDFGAGEYTRDYFLETKRYTFLQNRSKGHSVPIINQEEQVAGDVGTQDVGYTETEKGWTFEMTLTEAYGKKATIHSFRRKWEMDEAKKTVSLVDSLLFTEENNVIQQNFVSRIKPKIGQQTVLWQGKQNEVKLAGLLPIDEVTVLEEDIQNHQGKTEKVYRLLITTMTNAQYDRRFDLTIV